MHRASRLVLRKAHVLAPTSSKIIVISQRIVVAIDRRTRRLLVRRII
jgi:hypothetical protein